MLADVRIGNQPLQRGEILAHCDVEQEIIGTEDFLLVYPAQHQLAVHPAERIIEEPVNQVGRQIREVGATLEYRLVQGAGQTFAFRQRRTLLTGGVVQDHAAIGRRQILTHGLLIDQLHRRLTANGRQALLRRGQRVAQPQSGRLHRPNRSIDDLQRTRGRDSRTDKIHVRIAGGRARHARSQVRHNRAHGRLNGFAGEIEACRCLVVELHPEAIIRHRTRGQIGRPSHQINRHTGHRINPIHGQGRLCHHGYFGIRRNHQRPLTGDRGIVDAAGHNQAEGVDASRSEFRRGAPQRDAIDRQPARQGRGFRYIEGQRLRAHRGVQRVSERLRDHGRGGHRIRKTIEHLKVGAYLEGWWSGMATAIDPEGLLAVPHGEAAVVAVDAVAMHRGVPANRQIQVIEVGGNHLGIVVDVFDQAEGFHWRRQ